MLVVDDLVVCANDGCSRRFVIGWDGCCAECVSLAADHDDGLHIEPVAECPDCL
jgi:hypothetical protein